MTPLSRWRLGQEDVKKVETALARELAGTVSESEMNMLLDVMLSKNEKLMIGKRLFAFILMNQGFEDMHISRQLHLTRETVKRLRLRYEHQEESDKNVNGLISRMEKSELIKTLLKKFVEYAIPAMGGRSPRPFM